MNKNIDKNMFKADFTSSYAEIYPSAYMANMSAVDYVIPRSASAIVKSLIEHLQTERSTPITVFEIGVSYGVNPALIRCNLTLDDMYEFYHHRDYGSFTVADDRLHFEKLRADYKTHFIGLDRSKNAVEYAIRSGLIDHGIVGDFENSHEIHNIGLMSVDLVLSTGTIGYVGHKTISKIMHLFAQPNRVHHVHFVASPFQYNKIEDELKSWDIDSYEAREVFIQRRFSSQSEAKAFIGDNQRVTKGSERVDINSNLLAKLYISSPRGSDFPCYVSRLTCNESES